LYVSDDFTDLLFSCVSLSDQPVLFCSCSSCNFASRNHYGIFLRLAPEISILVSWMVVVRRGVSPNDWYCPSWVTGTSGSLHLSFPDWALFVANLGCGGTIS